MIATLIALTVLFTQLSLLAFGGGNSILPEMQREVVDVQHWMSAETFSSLFGLAQAAPGPNLMIVPLVGWHVAGWWGVLVTTLAKFGPSSVVTILALYTWDRFKDRPWRRTVQVALLPITAGLFLASALIITQASVHSWWLGIVTAVAAFLSIKTRIHPLWLLMGGCWAGLGGMGLN
ncbi:MAG: chromate transporter [Burkholderiaceae bacterium]|nr:chromate transporter [Burkholderiaceae bacterium]